MITGSVEAIQAMQDELQKLRAYKTYVDQRLSELGAPWEVPESKHTAAGCRVGGRFDWVAGRLSGLIEANDKARRAMDFAASDLRQWRQLGRYQRDRSPDYSHDPLCATDAGMERTDKAIGKLSSVLV